MKIGRWTKRDLKVLGDQGYMVVPCTDEKETESVYWDLKSRGKCAQCGYIVNREGVDVYFVLTKERTRRVSKGD